MSFKQNLHSLIQRPSTHLAPIDGLRALSILFTIIFHAFYVYKLTQHLHDSLDSVVARLGKGWIWVINGDKGVDVFFVLSGFLISLILFKEWAQSGHLDLKRFYWRRYLRLTPALYLAIAFYWLGNGPNKENLWANMLYLNNFLDYAHQAMGWTWSLAVEEQFYLIYPLTLLIFFKWFSNPKLGLWFLLVLSVFVMVAIVMGDAALRTRPASHLIDIPFFMHVFSTLYDDLHTRIGSLVIGSLAAYYYFYEQEKLKQLLNSRLGQLYSLIGLGLVLLLLYFPIFSKKYDAYQGLQILYYMFNRHVFSFGVALIILASLCQQKGLGKWLRFVLSWQIWVPFARLSYSMYLIHLMVIAVVIPLLTQHALKLPASQAWSPSVVIVYGFIISTAISILIASIMYLLVEKPLMNMRR